MAGKAVFCETNKQLYKLGFDENKNPVGVHRYAVSYPYSSFAEKVKGFWEDARREHGRSPHEESLCGWAEKQFEEDLGFGTNEAGVHYFVPFPSDRDRAIQGLKAYISDEVNYAGGLGTDALFAEDSLELVYEIYRKAGVFMMDKQEYVVQSYSDNFVGLPHNYYTDDCEDAERVYQAESEKGRAVELLYGTPGHYNSVKQSYDFKATSQLESSSLHTAKDNNLDFSQRYSVMSGTATYATADSLEDIDRYLSGLSDERRHFCKIGDHEMNLLIDGFDYLLSKEDNADRWRPWSFTHYFEKDEGCVILEGELSS